MQPISLALLGCYTVKKPRLHSLTYTKLGLRFLPSADNTLNVVPTLSLLIYFTFIPHIHQPTATELGYSNHFPRHDYKHFLYNTSGVLHA